MNLRESNLIYINSLRTPKGGIGKEMLSKLAAPPTLTSGWIRRLSLAPFPLETATKEQLAELWKGPKLPQFNSKQYSLREKPVTDPQSIVTIHFDGGTPCNIPSKGYGIGYGSYQINAGHVVRVDHKRPMSNNAAEIWTLCVALDSLVKSGEVSGMSLILHGDSQIALKWARASRRLEVRKKKGSDEFQNGIARLCELTPLFHSLAVEWKPRRHALKAFGH